MDGEAVRYAGEGLDKHGDLGRAVGKMDVHLADCLLFQEIRQDRGAQKVGKIAGSLPGLAVKETPGEGQGLEVTPGMARGRGGVGPEIPPRSHRRQVKSLEGAVPGGGMLPTGGGPAVGGQDLGQAELAGGLDLLQSQGLGEDGKGGEKIGQGRHLEMGPRTAHEGRG